MHFRLLFFKFIAVLSLFRLFSFVMLGVSCVLSLHYVTVLRSSPNSRFYASKSKNCILLLLFLPFLGVSVYRTLQAYRIGALSHQFLDLDFILTGMCIASLYMCILSYFPPHMHSVKNHPHLPLYAPDTMLLDYPWMGQLIFAVYHVSDLIYRFLSPVCIASLFFS